MNTVMEIEDEVSNQPRTSNQSRRRRRGAFVVCVGLLVSATVESPHLLNMITSLANSKKPDEKKGDGQKIEVVDEKLSALREDIRNEIRKEVKKHSRGSELERVWEYEGHWGLGDENNRGDKPRIIFRGYDENSKDKDKTDRKDSPIVVDVPKGDPVGNIASLLGR